MTVPKLLTQAKRFKARYNLVTKQFPSLKPDFATLADYAIVHKANCCPDTFELLRVRWGWLQDRRASRFRASVADDRARVGQRLHGFPMAAMTVLTQLAVELGEMKGAAIGSDEYGNTLSRLPDQIEETFPNAVILEEDHSFGLVRTEVKCVHCESRLGHLFGDGLGEANGQR